VPEQGWLGRRAETVLAASLVLRAVDELGESKRLHLCGVGEAERGEPFCLAQPAGGAVDLGLKELIVGAVRLAPVHGGAPQSMSQALASDFWQDGEVLGQELWASGGVGA